MKKWKHLKSVKFWGASTSAHQIEGNTHNQWSVWEQANAERLAAEAEGRLGHWLPQWNKFKKQAQDPENYISGEAVDHFNLYEKDFKLIKDLNANAFRFGVEWSRIEPKEGVWDNKAIRHYRKYIKTMKKQGVEPVLTLWHWTMPVWFTDKGGFEKRRNLKYFLRFAQKVMLEFGDDVKYVCILNEPNVYAGMGYRDGRWPPNHRSWYLLWRVMDNLAHAHVQAYIVLKHARKDLEIGTAYHVVHFEDDGSVLGKIRTWFLNYVVNWWWMNKVKYASDYIGINHYFTERSKGLSKVELKGFPQNDLGWSMLPQNLQFVVQNAYKKYKKPIFVLENGLADAADKHRQWWLEQTFDGLNKAVANGVDLLGYTHWSLIDNFEWADGFWPNFGLVKVNRKNQRRTKRPSYKWYAKAIKEFTGGGTQTATTKRKRRSKRATSQSKRRKSPR